jgi:uncharacterized membrane protein YuzA (DUF378 family)
MSTLKRLEPLWLLIVILGGLNWAAVALFDTNVIAEIFGTGTASDVVYVIVGFAALMFVPRLVSDMEHMSGRHAHSH